MGRAKPGKQRVKSNDKISLSQLAKGAFGMLLFIESLSWLHEA
jgi:hypothetical protein